MQRKDRRTAVENIADRLTREGFEVEWIRQPVAPEPGFVTFSDPTLPSHRFKIKVIERFLRLHEELVKRVAEAQREVDQAHGRDPSQKNCPKLGRHSGISGSDGNDD